jgi:hypothetical protein
MKELFAIMIKHRNAGEFLTEEMVEEVWEKQKGGCFWMGSRLHLELLAEDIPRWGPNSPLIPVISKIDTSKGYVKDNIILCHKFSDLGREDYSFEKMRDVIQTIRGCNDILNKIPRNPKYEM